MQSRLGEFAKRDAVVLGISSDPQEKGREIVEAYGLGYPLLSDPELEAARLFGAVHPGGNPIEDGDIARPATFLIDREGHVVWYDLTENWRIRPRPERLLAELDRIP